MLLGRGFCGFENKKGVSDKLHLKTTDLLWGEGHCKELHKVVRTPKTDLMGQMYSTKL